ncbi:hypothetical protein IC235_09345 [Hymenobacter sp. BT664]|uniref:Uncharacterized protein n=1 Tax=Hymenobacter montanus TaxID=2771359 RepID=A0A927BDG8_9BACT|nr:hypothetical protein [Hymenobacter montanus]MBD2768093.1 hypothetical protein [Hymenobacter montanus]
MAYTIKKTEIIDYPPEKLKAFKLMAYEWIDNLNFTLSPKQCIENADEYVAIAKQRFLEDGWHGDGEVELMWVPPFMLNEDKQTEFTKGVVIWHVKQIEDGISWILYPKELFDGILFEKII